MQHKGSTVAEQCASTMMKISDMAEITHNFMKHFIHKHAQEYFECRKNLTIVKAGIWLR
jgi:hypothetical protein